MAFDIQIMTYMVARKFKKIEDIVELFEGEELFLQYNQPNVGRNICTNRQNKP